MSYAAFGESSVLPLVSSADGGAPLSDAVSLPIMRSCRGPNNAAVVAPTTLLPPKLLGVIAPDAGGWPPKKYPRKVSLGPEATSDPVTDDARRCFSRCLRPAVDVVSGSECLAASLRRGRPPAGAEWIGLGGAGPLGVTRSASSTSSSGTSLVLRKCCPGSVVRGRTNTWTQRARTLAGFSAFLGFLFRSAMVITAASLRINEGWLVLMYAAWMSIKL